MMRLVLLSFKRSDIFQSLKKSPQTQVGALFGLTHHTITFFFSLLCRRLGSSLEEREVCHALHCKTKFMLQLDGEALLHVNCYSCDS